MGYRFEILHADDDFVVIDKPEGFHVHKPEADSIYADPAKIVLQQLRDQLGVRVYPVHRLDVPTSGCLLVALNPETASVFGHQLQDSELHKLYRGVVRGWAMENFEIDRPLKSEDGRKTNSALSRVRPLARTEFPVAVGPRHPSARYTLVELEPVTGRFHQLRRHLNAVAHPLVGDVGHGDRYHNQFFRDQLEITGLCLRAVSLSFAHPRERGRRIEVRAPLTPKWERLEQLFQIPLQTEHGLKGDPMTRELGRQVELT